MSPSDPSRETRADQPPRRCPVCGRPADPATTPFCGMRCADVDLHRWLSGRYAIPAADDPDEDREEPDRR